MLDVTDFTTTTIHVELKAKNNEKKGLNSNERNRERNKKNEGQKIPGKNSSYHRSSDSSGRNSDSKFGEPLIVEINLGKQISNLRKSKKSGS